MEAYTMELHIRTSVTKWGLAGVLEILMVVCDEKAKATEDKKLKKKYEKAAIKLFQLSRQKFVGPL